MEHSSTDGNRVDMDSSGQPAPHIPTEVCENIIDMLYSTIITDTRKHITTLHSCALVSRAWRVRSQRMLFYRVQLSTSTSLRRLSTILDTGQHLREYVYEVQLTGHHLHNTTSIFALFPAVFARKLPNLYQVDVVNLCVDHETFPKTPDPPKSRSLPYIPLHSRFPTFLSSLTAVLYLHLEGINFRSFSEFARMLHGLPSLKSFAGLAIYWITPGSAHPGADFTKPPDWEAGRCVLPPFAPKLRHLRLWDMDIYGIERLVQTRGPHLTRLELQIPLWGDPEGTRAALEESLRLDLGSCTGLKMLSLRTTPWLSIYEHADFLTEMLTSWKPRHLTPELRISVDREDVFTRRGFADVLRDIGIITEIWLQAVTEPSPDGDFNSDHAVKYHLHVEIHDWDAEKEWWSDHVDACFPTWLTLGRLSLGFRTPTHGSFEWANEKQAPQPDVTLTVASRVEDDFSLSSLSESQDTRSPEIVEHVSTFPQDGAASD